MTQYTAEKHVRKADRSQTLRGIFKLKILIYIEKLHCFEFTSRGNSLHTHVTYLATRKKILDVIETAIKFCSKSSFNK